MTGAFVILGALIAVGAILYICDRIFYRNDRQTSAETDETAAEDAENRTSGDCCGMHIVCEKDSLSPFTTTAEYYDDEELDAYRGRTADSYSNDETEQFRDILLTMRTDEIAGWVRALQVRGVELPTEIREEVLLIIGEARRAKTDGIKQQNNGNT